MFTNLFDYICAWEGFSAAPYYATDDERERGILTIGYGFTYPNARRALQLGKPQCPVSLTIEEAELILQNKIENISRQFINDNLYTLLKVQVFKINGLVALAYNLGIKGFPELIRALREGNVGRALLQFYDGIYQSKMPLEGLVYRRACDAQIFEKGIYEKRDYITVEEHSRFLDMNQTNQAALDMINNKVKIK